MVNKFKRKFKKGVKKLTLNYDKLKEQNKRLEARRKKVVGKLSAAKKVLKKKIIVFLL